MSCLNIPKIYDIDKNFISVKPQFIDNRLTESFIDSNMPIGSIANSISHLLIYKEFLTTHYSVAIICHGITHKEIWPNTLYVTNDNRLSYRINRSQAKVILQSMPLSTSIDRFLSNQLHFIVQNIHQNINLHDPWLKLFDK